MQSASFTAQSESVRARVSAVLLSLCLHYADALAHSAAVEDGARFTTANVFDAQPAPVTPRGASSQRALSLYRTSGSTASSVVSSRDTPGQLLDTLAALLSAHAATNAGVALSEDLPAAAHDAFVTFLNFACKSPPLLEERVPSGDTRRRGWGAPARAAYLRTLAAFAAAPSTAFQIVSQLFLQAQHDDYEHLSWQEFFKLLAALHDKYCNVTADSRFAAPGGAQLPHPHTLPPAACTPSAPDGLPCRVQSKRSRRRQRSAFWWSHTPACSPPPCSRCGRPHRRTCAPKRWAACTLHSGRRAQGTVLNPQRSFCCRCASLLRTCLLPRHRPCYRGTGNVWQTTPKQCSEI